MLFSGIEINFFFLTACLFFIGIFGILFNKRNILIILLSLEIMLLAIFLNFVFVSFILDDLVGQVFVLYLLALGAAESAIGLSFFILYFRKTKSIQLENFKLLRF